MIQRFFLDGIYLQRGRRAITKTVEFAASIDANETETALSVTNMTVPRAQIAVNAPVGLGLPPLRFMERDGLVKDRERSNEASKRCSHLVELHYTAGGQKKAGAAWFQLLGPICYSLCEPRRPGMKITELFLDQLKSEEGGTRRVLERVPEGRADWKPHEKSMPLGYLATLVATMPGWVSMMVGQDSLDLNPPGGGGYKPPAADTVEERLAVHAQAAATARDALRGTADA